MGQCGNELPHCPINKEPPLPQMNPRPLFRVGFGLA